MFSSEILHEPVMSLHLVSEIRRKRTLEGSHWKKKPDLQRKLMDMLTWNRELN